MYFQASLILILSYVPFHGLSLDNELDVGDKSSQKCPEYRLTALLLGGTGATGKHVLKELHASDQISKITFITRRHIEFPDMPKVFLVHQNLFSPIRFIFLVSFRYALSFELLNPGKR